MDNYEYTELLKKLNTKVGNIASIIKPNEIKSRLEEIEKLEHDQNFWQDVAKATAIGKEKTKITNMLNKYKNAKSAIDDAKELYDLANSENDEDTIKSLFDDSESLEQKIVNLEIFDYLYNEPVPKIIRNNGKKVIVAGNLTREKSGYVYKLKELNVDMCLYGVNYEGDIPDDIYKGAFSPDELIQHLEGNFGLVWDGTSVEKCTGNTGAYLKYNNPHKTSLYLAADLPVIIWSQAAMADFVKRNNIGIVIDDLHHLSECLKGVSEKDYQEMQQNVRMIGKKIRQGYYFNTALDALK